MLFSIGGIGISFLMLPALVIYAAMIACMIIATVSLVRIARSLGEMVGQIDDLKRELEEMKRKE